MASTDRDYRVRLAEADDLPGVLSVQHEAFGRVARWFDIDPQDLPPLRETLRDLERLFADGMRFFVATAGPVVIGSVRGVADESGVVQVGRLVVDEAWLRQGVATALMDALEASWPEAPAFELFTGEEADVPLALYEGRGYARVRTETQSGVRLVWLRKPAPQADIL